MTASMISTNFANLTGSRSCNSSMAFLLSFSVMVGALISVAAALGGNSRFCVITNSNRSRPPSYVVSSRIVSESNKYISSPRMVRMASINSLTLLRGANNSFFLSFCHRKPRWSNSECISASRWSTSVWFPRSMLYWPRKSRRLHVALDGR